MNMNNHYGTDTELVKNTGFAILYFSLKLTWIAVVEWVAGSAAGAGTG